MSSHSKSPALALFCADVHRDTHNWSRYPDLCGDALDSFEQIVQLAVTAGVQAVFEAGDGFDTRNPPASVLLTTRKQLTCLQANSIDFYYIQGQHDLSLPPWLQVVGNRRVHHLERQARPVRVGKHRIAGLDWRPAERLQRDLQQVHKSTSILVLHQVWDEFMGSVTIPEGTLRSVPHTAVVFTGDCHVLHKIQVTGASGQQLSVISPGSTNLRSMAEPREKYVFLLHENGTWSQRQLRTRAVYSYLVETEDQLHSIADTYFSDLQKYPPERKDLRPILYLECAQECTAAETYLRKFAPDLLQNVFLFTKPSRKRVKERVPSAARSETLNKGPLGCLDLVLPPEDKRKRPLLRLLSSRDQKTELLRMRKERLEKHAAETVEDS